MRFLKELFSFGKINGPGLAQSDRLAEFAQIDLLARFQELSPLHSEREQRQWERALPRSYDAQIKLFRRQGWLLKEGEKFRIAGEATATVALYVQRLARERNEAMTAVREALTQRETSDALHVRRRYEAAQPMGSASWTGPDPQLSHSALTRRILFLDNWLLADLSADTKEWLRLYAAEQHLWGTRWMLAAKAIPEAVATELGEAGDPVADVAYWRSYQLILYVENQETWQRCKGGDHVRRLSINGPDDEATCAYCRGFYGEQYLVDRVPSLPHRECTSRRGCRCEYEPVLEMYDDLPGDGAGQHL